MNFDISTLKVNCKKKKKKKFKGIFFCFFLYLPEHLTLCDVRFVSSLPFPFSPQTPSSAPGSTPTNPDAASSTATNPKEVPSAQLVSLTSDAASSAASTPQPPAAAGTPAADSPSPAAGTPSGDSPPPGEDRGLLEGKDGQEAMGV